MTSDNVGNLLDREPRTVIHVKRAKRFTPWVDLRCHQYPENGYSVHSNWPLHLWTELNCSTLLCISSFRLGMSWCVQPQVNGIPSNRRLAIGSARSDICCATNSTWSDIFIESTLMRYVHSKGGLTGITLNDMAVCLLAHSLHSRSPLVRNLTIVQNELSKDPSSGRIQCTDPG